VLTEVVSSRDPWLGKGPGDPMLDTLKTLLEVIDHIVKNFNFLQWRNDKRLSHIGSKLCRIMIAANETVATGWEILRAIESFIGNDRVKLVLDGKLPYTKNLDLGISVRADMASHIVNLQRLVAAIKDASQELQILDPETYRKLSSVERVKLGSLSNLLGSFSPDAIPLAGFTPDVFEKLLTCSNSDVHALLLISPPTVKTGVRWGKEEYDLLTEYVARVQPRQQLADLETIVTSLRTTLEKHFEIKDILLKIGR
jgi:hypothetical protein